VGEDFIRVGQILFREYDIQDALAEQLSRWIEWHFVFASSRWPSVPVTLYCRFGHSGLIAPISVYVEVMTFTRTFSKPTIDMRDPLIRLMETTMIHTLMLKRHGKKYADAQRLNVYNDAMEREYRTLAHATFGHDRTVVETFSPLFEFSFLV
jgi:hypothetical protein